MCSGALVYLTYYCSEINTIAKRGRGEAQVGTCLGVRDLEQRRVARSANMQRTGKDKVEDHATAVTVSRRSNARDALRLQRVEHRLDTRDVCRGRVLADPAGLAERCLLCGLFA
jgi:hypothetical protein